MTSARQRRQRRARKLGRAVVAHPPCVGETIAEESLLVIEDVASILRLSVRSVYKLVEHRQLTCIHVGPKGRGLRFTVRDVREFVERRSTGAIECV